MAARRKSAKKAAKKAAGRRVPARGSRKRAVAKKRVAKPARKAAKKRVAKPARRAAKKRAAKPARKAAKKRVAKPARKAAKKRATARRPARREFEPAFAPQATAATAKDLLLFEIERGRVAVLAAIQGLGSGTALRPVAEGKWSIHEIVLHLAVRDRARLDEFESLLAGNRASWADVTDVADQAAMNESDLAPLRGLSWDEAVRLLMTTRAELLAALETVPAEPAAVWTESHPFGDMMHRLPLHDRGHAEAIKNARIAG
jgi:hypothetical protein